MTKHGLLIAVIMVISGLLLGCNTIAQTQTIAVATPQNLVQVTEPVTPQSTDVPNPVATLTSTPSPTSPIPPTETPKPTTTRSNTPTPTQTPLPPTPTATLVPITFNGPDEALSSFDQKWSTAFTLKSEGGQLPTEIIFVGPDRIAKKISTTNILISAKNTKKDVNGLIESAKLSATVTDQNGEKYELVWSPAGWAVTQFSGENFILALDTNTTSWEVGHEEKPDEYTYGLILGTPELMEETRESTDVWVASSQWWTDGPYPNETPLIENPKDGISIMDTETWIFKTILATNNPSPSDADIIKLRDALRNNQTTIVLEGKKVDLTNIDVNDKKVDLTKPIIYTQGLFPENGNTRVGTSALTVKKAVVINPDGSININIAPKNPTDLGPWIFSYSIADWLLNELNIQPTQKDRVPINKKLSNNVVGIWFDQNGSRQVVFPFLPLKATTQSTEFSDTLKVEPYVNPNIK